MIKKHFKKLVSIALSAVKIMGMSVTSFAAENTTTTLSSIAENTIQISSESQDSGAVVTTYDNLPLFIETVHNQLPNTTDEQLADFIIEYSGQDSTAIPSEDKLEMLNYESISNSKSYVKITENGDFIEVSQEEALIDTLGVDTSSDGYMELNTSFSKRKTVGSDKYFTVWSYATWLKWPAVALTDVLVISTSGTFDDSFSESGYVNQTFQCTSGCSKNTYRNRSVSKTSLTSDDLTMKYSNYVPYLNFTPISPRCDYCGGGSKDKYFKAYLKYGVITSSSCNIQASYGHKTFGVSGISVSVSAAGPSISVGVGSTISVYNGRAVTVK